MIVAPKATQAIFAALGDFYTWKLGEKVYGHGSNEAWAAVCSYLDTNQCFPSSLVFWLMRSWTCAAHPDCLQSMAVVLLDPHVIELP